MRTRRWLNKSLYSAGIARGLEVRRVPKIDPAEQADALTVIVTPGLALDNEGREIILMEDVKLEVCSLENGNLKAVAGNYLVVEYWEETVSYESGGCEVRKTDSNNSKSSSHYGGPSRIQAQAKFSWLPYIPNPKSGQIVLARVELKDCTSIQNIDAGIRKYIGSSATETVRQYVLEGEREIAYIPKESFPAPAPVAGEPDSREDVDVVGRIYFHVRGRQSTAVTLHLRAELYSQLHYTELPRHNHPGSGTVRIDPTATPLTNALLTHTHSVTARDTDEETSHTHGMVARRNYGSGNDLNARFELSQTENTFESRGPEARRDILDDTLGSITGGQHTHPIAAFNTESNTTIAPYNHTHPATVTSFIINHQGINDSVNGARQGDKFTFVDDLQVYIYPAGDSPAPVNYTQEIIVQLKNSYPGTWEHVDKLGNGSSTHVLAKDGTGAIRLDYLPDLTFSDGEYCIEFRIYSHESRINTINRPRPNGGKIHYNLYIE